VSSTVVICILLGTLPLRSASSDDHGQEHGHEAEHEDEHEAAVEITDEVLASAGMILDEAKSKQITPFVRARGQITETSSGSMNVKPRFSGIVRSIHKDFGDSVQKGEQLLVVESSSTRSSYSIRSSIDGIIADKRVVLGSFVPENESILRVVDLSKVLFQGKVFISEANKIRHGMISTVKDRVLDQLGHGTVQYVSPVVEEDTQSSEVRIEIDNKEQKWRIGSFAEADIFLESVSVKVAVHASALQDLNGQLVVFKRDDEHIEPTSVKVGLTDGTWTEILEGLKAGEKYVSANSFLAKAELLKSTAEHEH
jgi:cobalt-zinc-cadmium efflux system membrane fusion protein